MVRSGITASEAVCIRGSRLKPTLYVTAGRIWSLDIIASSGVYARGLSMDMFSQYCCQEWVHLSPNISQEYAVKLIEQQQCKASTLSSKQWL